MGVIADLHHGLAPSAMDRLEAFMEAVDERKPDLLFQLGDFNYGRPDSNECMDLWNQFDGPTYHVLGNHDMDFFGKEHMQDLWEMPGRYYSFDRAGFHFVVLDRNNLRTPEGFVPYDASNFYVDGTLRAHADPEQLEWLRADLQETALPAIVFVHQELGQEKEELPLDTARGAIEHVLQGARFDDGRPKVHSVFNGHAHVDRYYNKFGIHFVWINSASYCWVGEPYGRMADYTEPLFAFIDLHDDGVVEIKGRQADWVPPTPKERGFPRHEQINTYIADRRLS